VSSNQPQTQALGNGIATIEALEELLGLDELNLSGHKILTIADQAGGYYTSFILERDLLPFACLPVSNKQRQIDAPVHPLKTIQERINERILAQVNLPDYIMGGVKGKSTTHNALIHQEARVLVTIDIARYFPSIINGKIFNVWNHILGFPSPLSTVLTRLTTHKGCLPQGAPTSTSLANIFLHSIDGPIRKVCERLGIVYTAWVDDLNFSGDEAPKIIPVVKRALSKAGLRISRDKLKISGPGDQKLVTGIVLGPTLSVPQKTMGQIRAGIHNLRQGKVPHNQRDEYALSLEGRIVYVKSINKYKGEQLLQEFKAAMNIAVQIG
jgi:Reverse transcriptase (RNA-dependent DNA polymerase).